MTSPELSDELQRLDRRWTELTAIPETPRSLLNVIEYSLGTQQKAEVYVNRLLAYFLDTDEPHGLDADLLRAFLETLPTDLDFQEDIYNLSNVRVETQVPVTEGNNDGDREGFADLVIHQPNEWLLLVELKFSAGENNLQDEGKPQTVFYHDAPHVGGKHESEYESGRYYLYLHPGDTHEASSDEFTNWTWADLIDSVLKPLLSTDAPRYPQRTVAQLREFIDDIADLTGMTDRQQTDQEKIELYLEHHDAIEDVSNTFQKHWEQLNDEWATRLGQALVERSTSQADGPTFNSESYTRYAEVEQNDADQWALVTLDSSPSNEGSHRWVFRAKDNDWAHLFKEGWWKSKDELTDLYARDANREDIRISLIHRFDNRDLAAGERTLKFYVRNCGSNDTKFRNRFNEHFEASRGKIQEVLPASAELTGERRNKITATYPIHTSEYDTFSESYIAALERAFIDFTVDNMELIERIDQILKESVEVYDGDSN